jgi:anti-sigma factor RsiW
MTRHLSPKQISKCIAGSGSAAEQEHGRSCPECAAEIARFEGAIAGLRVGLSRCAEERSSQGFPAYAERPAAIPGRLAVVWRGALAAAAAVVLAVVPVYWGVREAPPEPQVQADAELLDEVDQQLSRSVPRTLEPLMDLLAVDETDSNETEGSRQ